MAVIIDRRLSKRSQNSDNKEKFKERHNETIKRAIKEKLDNGSIKDIMDMDHLDIPISDQEADINIDRKNMDQVFIGNKKYRKGDTLPKPQDGEGKGNKAGKGKGEDDFIYTVTKEDLEEYLYKHLQLPFLTEKMLKELSETQWKNAGYKAHGLPSNLSVVRSFRNAVGRQAAMEACIDEEIQGLSKEIMDLKMQQKDYLTNVDKRLELKDFKKAIPFLDDVDLRYRYKDKKEVRTTKAVMICLMDVSGSMDENRKMIAKNFFILLALFLRHKYEKIEIVFVAHDVDARIVNEKEFFESTHSGGTQISSGLELVQDTIRNKYPPTRYNIYLAHATDGDNYPSDDNICINMFKAGLLPLLNMYVLLGTAIDKFRNSDDYAIYKGSFVEYVQHESKENKKVIVSFIDEKEKVFDTFIDVFKKREE